jgi:hypothetical protein
MITSLCKCRSCLRITTPVATEMRAGDYDYWIYICPHCGSDELEAAPVARRREPPRPYELNLLFWALAGSLGALAGWMWYTVAVLLGWVP